MKYLRIVQSGNTKQSESNGMDGFEYSFAIASKPNSLFSLKDIRPGSSRFGSRTGEAWSIPRHKATSFNLQLFFEEQSYFTVDNIPF